ncbi:acetyl-CoA sensor PanZ family protein [Halomonas sp. ZH2S]|uniref:Acetyl-CoA sensor PanZ family protein n=1 Tax=Vreelandella zhuhanensis TaxID=2684210 RepID=A0A7X3H162_9GAMM|nr:acetyl-CoA sensor PanZ family protein [Halomonas zhuhanensis]MWJ28637.1 acetyl-CoA sensor PanZ family protein [Halomonas zhuhanensis]
MPVTLQYVDQMSWEADAQIRLDIVRIYRDAPPDRMACHVESFIERHLKDGHCFACAHFNDRLLGAVAITAEADALWLTDLCVRKITRRRGVGSRLMALLAEQAASEGKVLRIATHSLPLADRVLLSRLGYRPIPRISDLNAAEQESGQPIASDYVELDPQGKG